MSEWIEKIPEVLSRVMNKGMRWWGGASTTLRLTVVLFIAIPIALLVLWFVIRLLAQPFRRRRDGGGTQPAETALPPAQGNTAPIVPIVEAVELATEDITAPPPLDIEDGFGPSWATADDAAVGDPVFDAPAADDAPIADNAPPPVTTPSPGTPFLSTQNDPDNMPGPFDTPENETLSPAEAPIPCIACGQPIDRTDPYCRHCGAAQNDAPIGDVRRRRRSDRHSSGDDA